MGNKNWMRAREGVMKSAKFDSQLESLYPIVEPGGSDSAAFDNVLQLLVTNGVLSLPEAVMMVCRYKNVFLSNLNLINILYILDDS